MSYDAKVFNVMIASPGDVESERAIIRDIIYEWNAIHSNSRNIVLLPVGWESHSSPEMGTTPQEIINNQILDKCDLLIGVFWTRIGTKTDNYQSGTVEEIEELIKLDKPVMLYFSSQPVAIEMIDQEQITELKKFKDSCQKKGLYEEYDNYANFRNSFNRQLQLKLNAHELFKNDKLKVQQEVIESQINIPHLSKESRILLKEASLDRHGSILCIRHLGGTDLQTNSKNLIQVQERREVSKWEEALKELKVNQLIIDRGHKGEIFEITNLGYQIADMIKL